MTVSDHKKVYKQLVGKPAKLQKFIKHNAPKKRTFGRKTKICKICGRHSGHISKYHLNLCRSCFKDAAINLGFKKYN